jgi:hypothetical protein
VLHAQEHAEHVGVERIGIARGSLRDDRTGGTFGAGIVDSNIEAAEARDRAIDEILDILLLAHVGTNEFGFRPKRPELGGQRTAGIVAAAGDHETGSLTRKSESGGAANAGQGTGNEDD